MAKKPPHIQPWETWPVKPGTPFQKQPISRKGDRRKKYVLEMDDRQARALNTVLSGLSGSSRKQVVGTTGQSQMYDLKAQLVRLMKRKGIF